MYVLKCIYLCKIHKCPLYIAVACLPWHSAQLCSEGAVPSCAQRTQCPAVLRGHSAQLCSEDAAPRLCSEDTVPSCAQRTQCPAVLRGRSAQLCSEDAVPSCAQRAQCPAVLRQRPAVLVAEHYVEFYTRPFLHIQCYCSGGWRGGTAVEGWGSPPLCHGGVRQPTPLLQRGVGQPAPLPQRGGTACPSAAEGWDSLPLCRGDVRARPSAGGQGAGHHPPCGITVSTCVSQFIAGKTHSDMLLIDYYMAACYVWAT